jgi:hypothetical protein
MINKSAQDNGRIGQDCRVHRPAPPAPQHPVSPITVRTASLTRCGRSERAIRFRQYTSEEGSNPGSSSDAPIATFHRTSNRTASAASQPE